MTFDVAAFRARLEDERRQIIDGHLGDEHAGGRNVPFALAKVDIIDILLRAIGASPSRNGVGIAVGNEVKGLGDDVVEVLIEHRVGVLPCARVRVREVTGKASAFLDAAALEAVAELCRVKAAELRIIQATRKGGS